MSELLGIARFKFHEGKVEEYKRLSAQAMEIVRTKDSGTLQFDTYLNDDESECMGHRAVQGTLSIPHPEGGMFWFNRKRFVGS